MIELFNGFITIPQQGLEDLIIFTTFFTIVAVIIWLVKR